MTPIYRSPDRDQTQAMQSLLLDHHIQTSIIETKKSSDKPADTQLNNNAVIWYELWLRNLNELGRAKTIITQHEFTAYRTSMSSYRTSVVEQKKRSESIDQAIPPSSTKTSAPTSHNEKRYEAITQNNTTGKPLIPSPVVSQPSVMNPFLSKPSTDTSKSTSTSTPLTTPMTAKQFIPGQPRQDLIPINNKRVFKRLGLLLGFSEEEIQKWDNNNKLYRPWDAAELNESVKRLKQKCS